MHKLLLALLILFILIYPKFPLLPVSGSFVSIRLEDVIVLFSLLLLNFKLFKHTPLHRSVYLYIFIGIVAALSGILLTKTSSLAQGTIHLFRRIEYLSLFLIGYTVFDKEKHFKYLINIILLSSILISIYGLGQNYFKFPIITTTNSEFSKGLALTLGAGARINSTFAGHYDLAAFMLIPLILIVALLPIIKNKLPLYLLWGLNYWVMLLSASRITFASLFISLFILLLLIKKINWLPIFIILSITGFLLSPQLRGRYLDLITSYITVNAEESVRPVFDQADALKPPSIIEDRSLSIRLNAEWPRALRAFYKNPLFGSGYSSIGLASDNEYLRLLAETGLLGLLTFILIFVRYFKLINFRISHFKLDVEYNFLAAILCSIIGLLINAIFIDIFTASKIAFMTWLLMGITTKLATDYEK